MNNPGFNIRSYTDLLAEKQRLKDQFSTQKNALILEIEGLKDTLNPFPGIIKTVNDNIGRFTGPDNSIGILNGGIDFAVDLLLRRFVLKKSNWLVKLVAPFFIKNWVSHLAADKIKGKAHEAEPEVDDLKKNSGDS